ncbi:hypothetical protein PIB30_080988 [Stylosanthes scabra]|uniref:WIYLD domain-containing protein n=1 Tax=Stylosanthes scabra TaxID=79078 RepID=A0ABU6TR46_9FABA|nr:hypothetical protein [Stylosanthes scabra]
MAPRRSSKKRETRMDAAIDAMAVMGFASKLVRSTVNHLIKNVYGSDGWLFIEADGYKELIECLISDQEQQEDKEKIREDGQSEASPSGCSNRTPLQACSNTENSNGALTTNQAIDTVSASSQTNNQPSIKDVESASATSETTHQLPVVESAETPSSVNHLPIALSVETPTRVNQLPVVEYVEKPYVVNQLPVVKTEDAVPADNESDFRLTYSPQIEVPRPKETPLCKKRKPCYGWISDDDEEEEEEMKLIELPPASMSKVRTMLINEGVN